MLGGCDCARGDVDAGYLMLARVEHWPVGISTRINSQLTSQLFEVRCTSQPWSTPTARFQCAKPRRKCSRRSVQIY